LKYCSRSALALLKTGLFASNRGTIEPLVDQDDERLLIRHALT
jgi:hypothetical protein